MEELSGLYDKKTLDKIYRIATNDRHGFLYVDLTQSDKTNMFYKDLNKQIVVNQKWNDKHALCLQYMIY